jgi:hypothetical protein
MRATTRAAPHHDPSSAMQALLDDGERLYRRFTPTAEMPATVELWLGRGGKLRSRGVIDISLGGLGFPLRFREHRIIDVGSTILIKLKLANTELSLNGVLAHLYCSTGRLFSSWQVGISLASDDQFVRSRPKLIRYLLATSEHKPLAG